MAKSKSKKSSKAKVPSKPKATAKLAKPKNDYEKVLAALSYVWVLVFVPFVLGHDKPFVAQHAKQGLALFVFELLLLVLGVIPILGWLAALAGWLAVMVAAVIGIVHALAGKPYEIPILNNYIKDRF